MRGRRVNLRGSVLLETGFYPGKPVFVIRGQFFKYLRLAPNFTGFSALNNRFPLTGQPPAVISTLHLFRM